MTLAFLNPSRSYDETRRAVRFLGHDGMFEIRFFVEVDVFAGKDSVSHGDRPSEAASLSAFDTSIDAIHHVAKKAYAKNRRDIYTLTVDDFV